MHSNKLLYGYNLNDSIEFRVGSGLLINIKDGRLKKLSSTNIRLLSFFIERAQAGWIRDDDIAEFVFENAGLRSSPSRLRGAIRHLKDAFIGLGFQPNFISRNARRGYYLRFEKIEVLIALDEKLELTDDFGFYKRCNDS